MIDARRLARSRFPARRQKTGKTSISSPKSSKIAGSDRLQIKDLREQFPTLANRELNRANREAKSAQQGTPEKHQGHAGLARGLAIEAVRRQVVEIGVQALLVLDAELPGGAKPATGTSRDLSLRRRPNGRSCPSKYP
jgi:hypothetical protein